MILNILWTVLGAGMLAIGLGTSGLLWRAAAPPSRLNGYVLAALMIGSFALSAFGGFLLLAALATFLSPEVIP